MTSNYPYPVKEQPLRFLAEELHSEEFDGFESSEFHPSQNGDGECDSNNETLQQQSLNIEKTARLTNIVAVLVILVGAIASASFLYLGISNEQKNMKELFNRRASDMSNEIVTAWDDYESSALWIHESCRDWRKKKYTYIDFEILYKYLVSKGLEFEYMEWVPNITHNERKEMEALSAIGWNTVLPEGDEFAGFIGLEGDDLELMERSQQEFYFPIFFAEPRHVIAVVAGYDLYSPPWERPTIIKALQTYKPALTGGFQLIEDRPADGYSVVLFHPGANLVDINNTSGRSSSDMYGIRGPKDLSTVVINTNKLLIRAARNAPSDSFNVYLYDSTDVPDADTDMDDPEQKQPSFLGALEIKVQTRKNTDTRSRNNDDVVQLTPLAEKTLSDVKIEHGYKKSGSLSLYYEDKMMVGGRIWSVVVVPVLDKHDPSFRPNYTFIIIIAVIIFLASIFLAIWMIHNTYKSIQLHRVVSKAAAEASIVSNLFPAKVRKRMIQDAEKRYNRLHTGDSTKEKRASFNMTNKMSFKANLPGGKYLFSNNNNKIDNGQQQQIYNNFLTSEGIFGSNPIAELHPYTTVMFLDLCGFTAWASIREASQVFSLLEIIYHYFDNIARRRRVFKVESVADCYVAVCGLPEPRKDHAVVMSIFANDCLKRLQNLCIALETSLGPDTRELGCRIGLHSGQVTAGVMRGDKGRFQLFGDSYNKAAKMEASGVQNMIHVSQETADLITEAGYGKWAIPREDPVSLKGIGVIQTYFIKIVSKSKASRTSMDSNEGREYRRLDTGCITKTDSLVQWNVEILSSLLKKIIARRIAEPQAKKKKPIGGGLNDSSHTKAETTSTNGEKPMVLDEVKEIITLPGYRAKKSYKQIDPESIQLDAEVVEQLSNLISEIASMYRDNPFHCFEHASHVTMSVVKMMGRINEPKEIVQKKKEGKFDEEKLDAELHQHTFGITSDPLTQFACAFSALIHDLDHQGVTNMVLVKEGDPLAAKYNNKSVAEQNSVDLAWDLLMSPDYCRLRECICWNTQEFYRFRSLVVNSVMATDIMDKELGAARKERWEKAFSKCDPNSQKENSQMKINRKATIVIEHLIQASDVSHTMQHWHIYAKWNERLFQETYRAYKAGRIENDPVPGWYKGEIGFFDFYIIPLAKTLFKCGVFGVSSDEFLNYALNNRNEWEQKGAQMVDQYLKKYDQQSQSEQ